MLVIFYDGRLPPREKGDTAGVKAALLKLLTRTASAERFILNAARSLTHSEILIQWTHFPGIGAHQESAALQLGFCHIYFVSK